MGQVKRYEQPSPGSTRIHIPDDVRRLLAGVSRPIGFQSYFSYAIFDMKRERKTEIESGRNEGVREVGEGQEGDEKDADRVLAGGFCPFSNLS